MLIILKIEDGNRISSLERRFKINGGLAQLGERYAGSVEVIGSIPLSSTIFKRSNRDEE